MDSILYWNDVSLEANRISHTNDANEQTGPTLSSRALAIVHLAMYDAFAGVANTPGALPIYLAGPALPPPGASSAAAVAAAAHATLSALFPSQRAFFDLKHQQAGLQGGGMQEGHAYGLAVAQAILKARESDPGAGAGGYAASMRRGGHRTDPDNPGQGFHGPYYGTSKCFAVKVRHDLDAPPQPGDAKYLKALKQVRGKGIAAELMGTLPAGLSRRTAEEYLIGLYWGYDGARGLGTPPRLYNQIIRAVANDQGNDEAKNARLFAFVNAAMADAGILAWQEKYRYDLWRPVVGIREHDVSMGPAATAGTFVTGDCDPGWLPLGAPSTNALLEASSSMSQYPCQHTRSAVAKNFTPPFPAYPSGHATFGAAAFHVTRLFYNAGAGQADNLFSGLGFVSEELDGISRDNRGAIRPRHVRAFSQGLWGMILENGLSRVYLGVHWLFDAFAVKPNGDPDLTKNVGGVPLGLNIAEDIYQFGGKKAPKKSPV